MRRATPHARRSVARIASLLVVAFAAQACDPLAPIKGIDEPQSIADIAVVPDSTTIIVGDTLRFAAELKSVSGKPILEREITWTLGNPGVATVSDSGLVTARAVGRTEVLATVENLRASAVLIINPVPPPPPAPATP
jgi:hypothetical protein